MRTITTQAFKFNELSQDAKETAISNKQHELMNDEFGWSEDYFMSVKKGLAHFGFTLENWSIDWNNINTSNFIISSDHRDEITELSGARLFKYIQNNGYLLYRCKYDKKIKNTLDGNYPFTGFCADEDFLDCIRQFMEKPTNQTFEELMNDAAYNCFNAGCKDYEHTMSEDYAKERLEEGDEEFTEDGEMI